jgi:hypothetical protein
VYPDIWLTYDFYLRRPVVELDRGRVRAASGGLGQRSRDHVA